MIWIVFLVLTLSVIAVILVPFLRTRPAAASRTEYDLTVYRDQLSEIDRETERGTLSGDQAEAARTEVQRRILALGAATESAQKTGRPWGVAALTGLGVPLIAFGLYVVLGSPDLPDRPYAARAEKIKEMTDQGEFIRNMVASLTAKLEQNPNDVKGWSMLGRSLQVLGRIDESINAYRKAAALSPGDSEVRMILAGLLLRDIPQGSELPAEFVQLMREVLAVDPNNVDALYFGGVAAQQSGDITKARDLWTKVMMQLPEGADRDEIKSQIDALK